MIMIIIHEALFHYFLILGSFNAEIDTINAKATKFDSFFSQNLFESIIFIIRVYVPPIAINQQAWLFI